MEIGEKIKKILKERGLRQQDLATLLDVSLQNVKQLLGKPSIKIDTLERIANALDIPMWQFFASPEDIRKEIEGEDAGGFRCPHCGKAIKITVAAEPELDTATAPNQLT